MWLTKFNKLMLSDQWDHAWKLRDKNLPVKIYKFRAVNKNSINNLQNNTIWLSTADKYNDPYECCATFNFDRISIAFNKKHIGSTLQIINRQNILSKEENDRIKTAPDSMQEIVRILNNKKHNRIIERQATLIELLLEIRNKPRLKWLRIINELAQKGMKICSFSSRNDSNVMWGHYADGHKGFSIEYKLSELPKDEKIRFRLFPVIYSKRLYDITKYIILSLNGQLNNLWGIMTAIYKSPDWSYEKEWRIILLAMVESIDGDMYPMPRPSALYLGSRINKKDEKLLLKIAERKSLPAFKMKMSFEEFKMVPEAY